MEQQSVVHNTFVVERNYPQAPENVFAALADPAKKQRWYARGEHSAVESFEMDFRVGGWETTRSRFKEGSPFPGVTLESDAVYQDIVTNRRLVLAQTMGVGGRHISSSLITIELLKAEKGTDLILTHQGAFFEGSDGPKMREEGWRKLLEGLAAALENV
jgi:uncharacterized protein YndB with AHSA1/START domain